MYAELRAEHEALRKRSAWGRAAADDDRERIVWQKLELMKNNRWLRPAAA
jgi:hypothetical protein